MCRICSIVRAEVFAYPSVYEEVQVEAERRKKHVRKHKVRTTVNCDRVYINKLIEQVGGNKSVCAMVW